MQNPTQSVDSLSVDWTFPDADTKALTHGLHQYPARFPPEIPGTLLDHWLNTGMLDRGDTVYDPFTGSGTTLVEARRRGFNARGNDINPFSVMLARASATPVDFDTLEESWNSNSTTLKRGVEDVAEAVENGEDVDVSMPPVRDGWFPEPQLTQLAFLAEYVNDTIAPTHGEGVARAYRLAIAYATRRASYQRNGEFKRYRMAEEDRDDHDPDVWALFSEKFKENLPRFHAFADEVASVEYEMDADVTTDVYYADSRKAADLNDDSVDAVVTSPPYGDHKTTVAYGEFSQDPSIVAAGREYDEMRQVDKRGLGGKRVDDETYLQSLEAASESLAATLETLRGKDGRSEDAVDFFVDYHKVMKQVRRVVKPGHPVAWVVANRTMSRVNIPTHLVTVELCEELGFETEAVIPRSIPNKTMPLENAPENIEGETGELMSDEYVIVMRSPETTR